MVGLLPLIWAVVAPLAATARADAPAPSPVPLRFDSEVVRLEVSGDTLTVEGIYFFACHAGAHRTATLFYPFPEDSLLGDAEMISVDCRPLAGGETDWERVPFEATEHRPGARWWVPLDRSDSLVVHARYRQMLRGNYARYILTSTQVWGEPLRHARFEVTLPGDVQITRSSYPLQRSAEHPLVPTGGGDPPPRQHHFFETADFMPEQDLTVEWATSPPPPAPR